MSLVLDEAIRAFTGQEWHSNGPVTAQELEAAQQQLGVKFPPAYVRFLQWSDGGEGKFSGRYLRFWRVKRLVTANEMHGVREGEPGRVAFATDDVRLWMFDFRGSAGEPPIWCQHKGAIGREPAVAEASHFLEFLQKAMTGTLQGA